MIDIKGHSWVLRERLSPTEREKLMILLQAAGFTVWHGIRNYNEVVEKHPYIAWAASGQVDHIFATAHLSKLSFMTRGYVHRLTLKQLRNELINYIKTNKNA